MANKPERAQLHFSPYQKCLWERWPTQPIEAAMLNNEKEWSECSFMNTDASQAEIDAVTKKGNLHSIWMGTQPREPLIVIHAN